MTSRTYICDCVGAIVPFVPVRPEPQFAAGREPIRPGVFVTPGARHQVKIGGRVAEAVSKPTQLGPRLLRDSGLKRKKNDIAASSTD